MNSTYCKSISSFNNSTNLNNLKATKFNNLSIDNLSEIKLIQLLIKIYKLLLINLFKFYNLLINFIFRINDISTSYLNNKNQFYNYKFNNIPLHLQFNSFILTGYRSNLNFKQSLLSLFYIHNETCNIYSHAFAFIYFSFIMPKYLPWTIIYSNNLCLFFAICHIIATVSPWFVSTIYHLFMNYNGDQLIYNKLLNYDVFGIWITQSFGALLPIYMSVIDFNLKFRIFYLVLYILLSIRSLYDVLIIGGRLRRRFGFTILVLFRFLSIYLRTFSSQKLINYNHLINMELFPIIGGLIVQFHIPEVFLPGVFDLFLNSHFNMHCLVVLGAYYLHLSAIDDLILLSKY